MRRSLLRLPASLLGCCLLCPVLALAADPPTVQAWPQEEPPPAGYAVLNISRQGLESGSACDVDLYVRGRLLARLQPEGSVALNLPPGPAEVRLASTNGGACRNGMEQLQSQSLQLRAGQISNYRVGYRDGGLFLIPVNAN